MRTLAFFAAIVLGLTAAAPTWAAPPWEPDPQFNELEGPYVITGIGPPNANVELVEDNEFATFSNDGVLRGEYTSPTGQFRIDIGNCTSQGTQDTTPCEAAAGTYRIAFFRGTKVTRWATNSLTRVGATPLNVAAYDGQIPNPRTPVVVNDTSAPLAEYQRIRGFVRGIPPGGGAAVPLQDVRVEMHDAAGRNYEFYNWDQVNVGNTSSVSDGYYSVRVPPGSWKLFYKADFAQGSYPSKWSGCANDVSGATFIDSGTENADITLGGPTTCTTANPSPSPGGGGTGSGGGTTGGGLVTGGGNLAASGGGVTIGTPAKVSGVKVVKSGPTVTLDLNVGGPGAVAAKTLTSYSVLASAAKRKDVVIATARATATKAGKVRLVLKPNRKAKKALAKKGRLKGTTTITFTPKAGSPTSVKKSVTFKRARKKK